MTQGTLSPRFSIAPTEEIRAGFPRRSNAFIAVIASLISTGREEPRFRGAWSRPWGIISYTIMPTPTGRFRVAARLTQPWLEARRVMATFLNATPVGNCFRPEHDHLDVPPGESLGADLGRVMRSSSPSWITTPTSIRGGHSSERGVTILHVPMIPETGELDWNDLDRCLNDHRTRLLAIGAASNALGTVNDVARAAAMAREAEGSLVHRRRPFRAASARRRRRVGLRLSGVLDVQVLRAAPRGALWPARTARGARRSEAPTRSRYDPRAARNRNAKP